MLSGYFLSVAAFVAAAVATPTLVLEVLGPATVIGVDELNITTTLKNVGDAAVKLLHHPQGPLSDLPTDMFAFTNRHGLSPDFVGISAKYSPSAALASKDCRSYTVLEPGQSVSVQHTISDAYDFSTSGPGQYLVKMKSTGALYDLVDGDVSILAGDRNEPFHTVTIVKEARSTKERPHRHSGDQCEAWQERAINAAIPLAQNYIRQAVEALKKDGPQGAEYKRWFGPGQRCNKISSVSRHFDTLADKGFAEYTYACDARFCANYPGLFGYVYPSEFGTIYLCKHAFETEIGGHDSRASTLIHEALSFVQNGDVSEHTYGQALALDLAETYPHLAATNADNYEYFAVAAAGAWSGEYQDDVSVSLTEVHFSKSACTRVRAAEDGCTAGY